MTTMVISSATTGNRGGFSLLELAISIAVIGIVAGGAFQLVSRVSETQQMDLTKQRLKAVEQALIRYASRNGHLPCPNDASNPTTNISEPKNGNCTIGGTDVAVPWQDLGISRSGTLDGWNRQISYYVFDGTNGVVRRNGVKLMATVLCEEADPADQPSACKTPAHDMTATEAESVIKNGDRQDYVQHLDDWLQTRGLTVNDSSGNAMFDPGDGNGAAFVLVSHGANGFGGFSRGGNEVTSAPNQGDDEKENRDNDDTLVDAQRDETPGSDHFDDIVRAMTIHEVARESGWTPLAGS